MKTVQDVLKGKGAAVLTIRPDATVYDAVASMAEHDVGALVVLGDDGKLAGLISERDYARKIILAGRASRQTRVEDIMTREVMCVAPGQRIDSCMALMTRKHVRHLPVLENDQLAGIISIGDVVKAIIEDQQFTIEQLEHYITGR
jgi:CBS domain-containing protein